MDRGYGFYPDDEGGLYTGGLITGAGLKSFRKSLGGPSVPSLTWGIKKLQREGTGQRLKNTKWWGFMQKALDQARKEYLASMTDEERARYLESKKKQLAQKERKKARIELVRTALEKLKGKDAEETAKNIAEALKIEGNPKTRVLRAALMVLYPNLRNLSEDERREKLKNFKVRNFVSVPRKKYKARSYIGFDQLEEKAAVPTVEVVPAAATKAPVAAVPKAAPKAAPKAPAKRGRPPRSAVAEILAKK